MATTTFATVSGGLHNSAQSEMARTVLLWPEFVERQEKALSRVSCQGVVTPMLTVEMPFGTTELHLTTLPIPQTLHHT
jgi:hypothetical protein